MRQIVEISMYQIEVILSSDVTAKSRFFLLTGGCSHNPYDHSTAILYGVPPPPLVLQQPGDFHDLPSVAIGLPLVLQQPCHSHHLRSAATGLDHYNVAFTYK